MLMTEETSDDINDFIEAWGEPYFEKDGFYQWIGLHCSRFSNLVVLDTGTTRLCWAI